MSKEKHSSYFLRTQSTILNGEKQIYFNSLRDNNIANNNSSNRKYLSTGSNIKKRKYLSKNKNKKNKTQKKKGYIGIDLQKVSGATHLYNNTKINKEINKNKIPINNSLNYYQYLTKKNVINKQEKEEEKNTTEANKKNVYKSNNNYSPFREIISNIKDKNKTNNIIIQRNNDNFKDVNKYLIKANTNKNNNHKEENKQNYSLYNKNNTEKEESNEINNNINYATKTYNNFNKNNNSKFTYIYNKYNNNSNMNNKNLYLNENIINDGLINKKVCLMEQIKNKTKPNQYKNINNNININTKNTNMKISKSYSLTNYNHNIIDINSDYTPLPYKSFLKSIFDQNYTNKFIKDFNINSSSRKIEKNKFDYDKKDDNNLKKLLEGVPRHSKEKNKNEIYSCKNRKAYFYNLNRDDKRNKKKNKNNFEIINNIMPPNKLIENTKENFN